MSLLDFFKSPAADVKNAPDGKIRTFYSDTVTDQTRREKIRDIEIPQEIRRFTTGDMPFRADGTFPGIRVRYDASRAEGKAGWQIRQFLDIKTQEGERLPPGLKKGQHDDILIGSPACDFDALRFLSEQSADRDHLIKQGNGLFSASSSPYKGYGGTPHWRAIAEKAKQPVDKNGVVQPVAAGAVLADHVTFDDPKQIEIRDSTLPPAIAPAPEPAQKAATQRQTATWQPPCREPEKHYVDQNPATAALREWLEAKDVHGDNHKLTIAAKERYDQLAGNMPQEQPNPAPLSGTEGGNCGSLIWGAGAVLGIVLLFNAGAGDSSDAAREREELRTSIGATLYTKGISPNAVYKNGDTILMRVVREKKAHTAIVRDLVAAGTDVNVQNKDGNTALMEAAANGHADIVRILVNAGADINAKDKYGSTALIWAKQIGRTDIVRLLIDKGAHVNAKKGLAIRR